MSAISAEAVAAELGISYDLFLRTRAELEGRGFPRPLPLASRPCPEGAAAPKKKARGRPPLRWSVEAVRDWIREPRAANSNTPAAARRAADRRDADALARLG